MTVEDVRKVERDMNRLSDRVHESYLTRGRSTAHREEWKQACEAFRSYTHPLFRLLAPEVLAGLRAGDIGWRREALLFLEADPWFFRSGYMKEKLLRALKRVAPSVEESGRIVDILLAVVDSRDRREFREYCRLAAHAGTDSLRAGLAARLQSGDARLRRRAAIMLTYLSN